MQLTVTEPFWGSISDFSISSFLAVNRYVEKSTHPLCFKQYGVKLACVSLYKLKLHFVCKELRSDIVSSYCFFLL